MADETNDDVLTDEELEAQNAEALPDREAMSVVWIEPELLPTEGKEISHDHGLAGTDETNEPLRGGEEL
jgi:hypothetical protein